jgi:uncharacterized membrane protein required for colicin V production
MNKLDLIVLIGLAAAFIFGYRRGFVLQLVSFLGMFVAWLTAYLFYDDIAPWVGGMIPVEAFADYTGYGFILNGLKLEPYIIGAISFSMLLIGVKTGLTLAGHLLNVLAKVPGLNMMNRWSGGMLALLEAAAVAAVSVHIMTLLPNDTVQAMLSGSRAAGWTMEWLPALFGKMKELPTSWI